MEQAACTWLVMCTASPHASVPALQYSCSTDTPEPSTQLSHPHLRVSLRNSASSRKESSMQWKAAAKHGSSWGLSVTGWSHTWGRRQGQVGG